MIDIENETIDEKICRKFSLSPLYLEQLRDLNKLEQDEKIKLRKQSITKEEKKKVKTSLDDLVKDKVIIQKYKIYMTVKLFNCLKPFTWLNDDVINFYLELLNERNKILMEINPDYRMSTCYFNSFFIEKLSNEKQKKYKYDNVKRWTKNNNIKNYDQIYIPVNCPFRIHWVAIVLYLKQKTIVWYDSKWRNYNDPNAPGYIQTAKKEKDRYLEDIRKWIKDEMNTKFNEGMNE